MGFEEVSFDKSLEGFERIGVAYSGGLDSTVLLHALISETTFKSKINAIHVNHSISPDSDKWEELCKKMQMNLELSFFHTN